MASKIPPTEAAAAAAAARPCGICKSTSNDTELLHFPADLSLPPPLKEVYVHVSCGESANDSSDRDDHLAIANKTGVVARLHAKAGSKARVKAAMDRCRCVAVGCCKYFLLKEVTFRLHSSSSGAAGQVASKVPPAVAGLVASQNVKVSPAVIAALAQVMSEKSASVASLQGGNVKASSKQPKQVPEKRLKRYRSKPTGGILQRIARARTQRLFLVDCGPVLEDHEEYGGPTCTLAVLGSTGNVYHVTLCKVPHCSCPDHQRGHLCKHILFVLIKVVGLPSDSELVYQAALLTTELEEIFQTMARRRAGVLGTSGGAVTANAAVRQRYAQLSGKTEDDGVGGAGDDEYVKDDSKVKRKGLEESTDCAICFDPLGTSLSGLTYCRAACGTNFHSQCIQQWASTSRKNRGQQVTCPACRSPWLDEATGGMAACSPSKKRSMGEEGGEGYTNLGSLQGQSAERDTSTYSEWYGGGYGYGYGGRSRRRYW